MGGSDAWYMLGHTFWNESFSRRFLEILLAEYDLPETADKLWEAIYMDHLDRLKMKIRRYNEDVIFEFDTLDELRLFDTSYVDDTRSAILKEISRELNCREREIINVTAFKTSDNAAAVMRFTLRGENYQYSYQTGTTQRI